MEVSVVMAAYNAEKYIGEAIDSVLRQSFSDFEFIIVDDASIDTTRDIIRSYTDSRIFLIENKHDFIDSINKGLSSAKGKYVAFMDNDDVMHIDRLKIEYSIMEDDSEITVCSSTMKIFGNGINPKITQSETGIIEDSLLKFIAGDFISNPTAMIRAEHIRRHHLHYERYSFAADYKFWVEVAKTGGVFYIESQPLLYYRISGGQASQRYNKEQQEASLLIRKEIVQYLANKNSPDYPELNELLSLLKGLQQKKLITDSEMLGFYQNVLNKNKIILATV